MPQEIYHIQDAVPPAKALLTGVQQVVAMFGATVLGPILMGFDPNVAILCSGFATIAFWFITGGRIPSYLGSSFAFIGVVVGATHYAGSGPNPNLGIGLGAIIAAGFAYLLLALIVMRSGAGWISRLLPNLVTGSIVGAIGLNLAPVAASQLAGGGFNTSIGLLTILLTGLAAVYVRHPFLRLIPIVLGLLSATILYFIGANLFHLGAPLDFAALAAAPLFGLPHLFAVPPQLSWPVLLAAAPIALILVAENLGHVRAIAVMDDPKNPAALDPFIGRAFFGDAVATIVAGAAGGTGFTTYAENIGVMSLTGVYASRVFLVAGALAVLLGFSPAFGALIHLIPTPVLGGLSFVVFGLVAMAGLRIITNGKVDFADPRNTLVAGVTLAIGAGGLALKIGTIDLGAIATASLAAIGLYHLLNWRQES